jgi:pimeloyl-ACP methyl ester carboxylesterase
MARDPDLGGRPAGLRAVAADAADTGRRSTRAVRRGVTTVLSPRGLRGTAVEAAWIATHVALYPLGVMQELAQQEHMRHRLEDLPPVQRGLIIGDVEAAGTPIILVHGIVDNRSIFTVLRRALRRRGFGRVIALNYSPLTADLRHVSGRLASLVEALCEETGYERVHVVGHSMGGLAARYYVQRLGGDERVHTLVTLGTPHRGTLPAYAVPHPLVRQLRPHSDLVTELDEPAVGCRTRMVAVWSDLDPIVIPPPERAHRPPGPAGAQRVRPRGRPHVPARERAGGARDLHHTRPPGPRRFHPRRRGDVDRLGAATASGGRRAADAAA